MADNKNKKKIDQEITNTLLDDFDKFEHMLMSHWKLLFGAGFMIVLSIGITMVVMKSVKAKNIKESAALVNTEKVEDVLAMIKKYPNNKAVCETQFKLAQMYLTKKDNKAENLKKALTVYSEIALDKEIPKILIGLALMKKGSLLEQNKKFADALKNYQELAEMNDMPVDLKVKAYYNAGALALCDAINDKKVALAMLSKVVELAPQNSSERSIAESQIANLGKLSAVNDKPEVKAPVKTKEETKTVEKKTK